ncbi:MAG: zinc ribbon domain-containing protein [Bacillota bacterium]|nr:zinc ribbon domain-containing protein [Bacillota bacterium]
MSNAFVSVMLLPILLLVLAIPVFIGVYVWRDANRRGMNAPLWTLVSVLAPTFIGLIVYLVVRGNYSDLRCPECDALVKQEFVVCPKCGAKLKPNCQSCGCGIEPDWKVCPRCSAPIDREQTDFTPPVRPKDKSLGKIILIAILIPVLLIIILVFAFSVNFGTGSISVQSMTVETYFADTDIPQVREWMETLETEQNHAYALRYDYSHSDGDMEYFYLVYVPGAGSSSNSVGHKNTIFGTALTLYTKSIGSEESIFCITASGDKAPKLKVELDGKGIDCEVTVVDYNPTTFYIVPQYDELEPGATNFFMPERITVVKLEDNHNVGAQVVEYEDVALNILVGIDSATYLELEHDVYGNPDGTGGYDFTDGFEIIIEYEANDELMLHEDEIRCLVFQQDGETYIIDSYRPDNGRIFRQVDDEFEADFYTLLKSLFEE